MNELAALGAKPSEKRYVFDGFDAGGPASAPQSL